MNSHPPKSDTDGPAPPGNGQDHGPTDFASLTAEQAAPPALPESVLDSRQHKAGPPQATDFESLTEGWRPVRKTLAHRTLSDVLISFMTPLLIFAMVASVLMFLLDVRYVYTEVHDKNLRFVAVIFIVGIVALNRLVARDGKEESILYTVGLGGAIALYTLTTTTAYDVGSVARNFLNRPVVALGFNMSIVIFLWWVTNRLMHECCVDELPEAGDVGILRGTARRLRATMRQDPKSRRPKTELALDAIDPTEWQKPGKKAPRAPVSATDRLPKRHPGVSVLYFSVPVMFIFAVGVRVVPHGGTWMIVMGYVYVLAYTLAALLLLMLTSLGQLRVYFRSRRIHIPGALGLFWIGLGTVFTLMVIFGAAALPNPGLPPLAHIDTHQIDFWTRTSTFKPIDVEASEQEIMAQSRFIRWTGVGVLVCLGLFIAYGGLKALGAGALALARRRDLLPPFVTRFFAWLDRLLQRLTRLPALPRFRSAPRVDRAVSLAAKYANPLGDPVQSDRMTVADQIEYAYDALCALAEDLGVPRNLDQTPHEFMESFPKRLDSLREEALELTNLYVTSVYAGYEFDPRVLDRLRKFWHTYERARSRVIR